MVKSNWSTASADNRKQGRRNMRPVGWNSKITTVARVAKSRCPRCTSSAPTERWHGHRELHLLPIHSSLLSLSLQPSSLSLAPSGTFTRSHNPIFLQHQPTWERGILEDKALSLLCLLCLGKELRSRAGQAVPVSPPWDGQPRAALQEEPGIRQGSPGSA